MKKKTGKKVVKPSKALIDEIVRNMELELDNDDLRDEIAALRNKKCEWLAPFLAGCFITFASILIISLYFA